MVRLSINVNKVATLRNSRGGNTPNVLNVVEDLVSWGVQGITVHPRPDGRHILYSDVKEIQKKLKSTPHVEFNVEGYPCSNFLKLMEEVKPHQCTLVPDLPTDLTSHKGWDVKKSFPFLKDVLDRLHSHQIRSSLFVEPLGFQEEMLSFLKNLSPRRVEFFTGTWVQTEAQKGAKEGSKILQDYKNISEKINNLQIGINAGHDLNQKNLKILLQTVPLVQEVSIGHAFICESLYEGLQGTLNQYFKILKAFKN